MASKGKICIALSGGVDSGVSAYLLQKQGYEVFAAFIKVWQPDFLDCSQEVDRLSAKRLAASLGIPFHVVDLSEIYKTHIVDTFISAYKNGETPNPDVSCNRIIKFGALWDWAEKHGATGIATGHYATIIQNNAGFHLAKSPDRNKDQVYFLWELKKELLQYIHFPIGKLTKPQVRELASEARLHVADKKDSQGLCFMGMLDMQTFLQKMTAGNAKKGSVIDEQGNCIGEHSGAFTYTIGQRHNFILTSANTSRQYVTAIDVLSNTITVGDLSKTFSSELTLRSCIWRTMPELGSVYAVQVRYHGEYITAVVTSCHDDTCTITLSTPQTVSKGQSCVFFHNEICIGGGIVASMRPEITE